MKVWLLFCFGLVAVVLGIPAATDHNITELHNSTTASTPAEGGHGVRSCECGLRERLASRIVGGERSQIQKYPWVVGIAIYGNIFCGGALIDERHILTAAHCFKIPEIIPHVSVHLGVTDRAELSNDYEIEEIISHEKYNKNRSGINDIALIRLARPVEINGRIRPICLPPKIEEYAGEYGTVAGWGVLEHDGAMSPTLREVAVQILELQKCRSIFSRYKKPVDNYNICAGGKKGQDACQGDSGSPLFLEVGGAYRVIGIVSWGLKCALDKIPGVYTNVAYYLPWIRAHIRNSTCI